MSYNRQLRPYCAFMNKFCGGLLQYILNRCQGWCAYALSEINPMHFASADVWTTFKASPTKFPWFKCSKTWVECVWTLQKLNGNKGTVFGCWAHQHIHSQHQKTLATCTKTPEQAHWLSRRPSLANFPSWVLWLQQWRATCHLWKQVHSSGRCSIFLSVSFLTNQLLPQPFLDTVSAADRSCVGVQTMIVGTGSTSRIGYGVWQTNATKTRDSTIKFSFGRAGISSSEVAVVGGLRVAIQLPPTGACSTPGGFCKPHLGFFCGVGLATAGFNFCPTTCVEHV